MMLAEVIGTVVAERMTDWISSPVFLLVQEVDRARKRVGEPLVALDPLGANRGEIVLVSQGSSCRQTDETKDRPVDAIIAGIVDMTEHDGKLTYRKDA